MKKIFLIALLIAITGACVGSKLETQTQKILKAEIVRQADSVLNIKPLTLVDFVCDRSSGGSHDFFSEGDYWWQNPDDPNGPYIRRDGETNPSNFVEHRLAMIRFSRIVGTLASAYKLTGDKKYADAAMVHIKAWFVDPQTMMNPNLLYAQAIKGVSTGRGIGIIDTIHLMEVAQALIVFEKAGVADPAILDGSKKWFDSYLTWLTTHKYGLDEMNAKNNHGSCWVMQVASFAKLTQNKELLELCKDRYKNILLPSQIADNGSFPQEMARTKPYGYSLFNIDVMTAICQILSTPEDDLWEWKSAGKPSIKTGVEFIAPFIADKTKWTLPPDVMYWDQWPVAHPSVLFAAIRYDNAEWFNLWSRYDHFPVNEEVVRNMPIKNPVIWID